MRLICRDLAWADLHASAVKPYSITFLAFKAVYSNALNYMGMFALFTRSRIYR